MDGWMDGWWREDLLLFHLKDRRGVGLGWRDLADRVDVGPCLWLELKEIELELE